MSTSLYITHECQLSCRYCFGWENADSGKKYMSVAHAATILDTIRRKGHRYLTVTGGEPFLHPDFAEIVKTAHDGGFFVTIQSNGLSMHEKSLAEIAKLWKVRVRLSLEGADAATHEYFRGKGTFAGLLQAVERLHAHRIPIGAGLTVYEENKDQVLPVVKFCIENGFSFMRVVPVVRIERGREARVNRELYIGVLEDLVDAVDRYREHIKMPETNPIPIPVAALCTRRCSGGKGFLGINAENSLMPCTLLRGSSDAPSGSFDGVDSLDRLTCGMESLLASIRDRANGSCGSCDYLPTCMGGCPGEKLSFGRTLFDEQPVCIKEILEQVLDSRRKDLGSQLISSWFRQMHDTIETDADAYCMRQAPFWKLDFNRRSGR